jgi:5'-phosphate synthase pdxT subunit
MSLIGLLALQGDFAEHGRALERAGARTLEVRTASELERCDGLVIPGGESTTILKLLHEENLWDALAEFGRRKPIYGTCAGAILLAQAVSHPDQAGLGLLNIDVERNAYGRQVDSRIAHLHTSDGEMEAVFIRAPIIRRTGENVRVLAAYEGDPVWVEQGLHMATTFHPELTGDPRVHRHFVERVKKARGLKSSLSAQACSTVADSVIEWIKHRNGGSLD